MAYMEISDAQKTVRFNSQDCTNYDDMPESEMAYTLYGALSTFAGYSRYTLVQLAWALAHCERTDDTVGEKENELIESAQKYLKERG